MAYFYGFCGPDLQLLEIDAGHHQTSSMVCVDSQHLVYMLLFLYTFLLLEKFHVLCSFCWSPGSYSGVKPEYGFRVWLQNFTGSGLLWRGSLSHQCIWDPVSYFCKHFPILRARQVCGEVTSFCGAQCCFVTVAGKVWQPSVSMRCILGPMHLAILPPSPSAFAIHWAFPGEFGFDQEGAGATYLGRTEK